MHAKIPRIKLKFIMRLMKKDRSRIRDITPRGLKIEPLYPKTKCRELSPNHISLAFAMMNVGGFILCSRVTSHCEQDTTTSCSNSGSTFPANNDTSVDTVESASHKIQNHAIVHDELYETCPFCRYFLDTPCSIQFQNWKECIDATELATDCMSAFHPLMVCMEKHGLIMEQSNDLNDNDDNVSS
jgi:hypothetical protein